MAKKFTNRALIADFCRKFQDTPTKTLARAIYAKHPENFPTFNACYIAVRQVRGANGKQHREEKKIALEHQVYRPHGKSGWKPECPPSAAEPWGPVQIDGPCKALVLSDIHVPYHSKEAVEAAVKFGKKIKPDVVLLNGDTLDNYRISRFQQDPAKRTFKQEIDTGKELLSWIRGQFREARIIFKMGNHDERWDHYVWSKCVELWDIEALQLHNVLDFEKYGIERVGDNPVCLGKLPVFHGHELGKGITSPVNPARGAFLRGNHTILVGHHHKPSSHPESDIWHNEIMTWSTGCLCDRRPQYARINKWRWGFAHVEVSKDNTFNMHNYTIGNNYQVRTA